MDESAQERLNDRIEVADNLLKRSKILENLQGSMKLSNKIRSEIRFLTKVKDGKIEWKKDHLKSTNLTSLEALLNIIEKTENKCGILQTFRAKPIKSENEDYLEDKTVCADIVSEKGSVWIKVIARSSKGVLSTYKGRGQYGEKSIISQAEQFLEAAEHNLFDFKRPKIYFVFCKGVPEPVAKELNEIGVAVEGRLVSEDGEDVSLEQNELITPKIETEEKGVENVNLDVTALLCMISNLCHGNHDFVFNVPVLSSQAAEEQNDQVLPKIEQFIENKTLHVCETAVQSFKSIVETVGGAKEKERAEILLKRINVVKDQPSERALLLKTSGKISKRSKIIFGTGDSLKAVTVTANTGFVRAAMQSGVRFSVFEHEARALTEIKQKTAQKIRNEEIENT